MTKLIHSLDIANSRKQEDIQTELEREERENEISQQESAYEQSIRADRERMLKQQEDEQKKRTEENKQRKEEQENLKKKEEMENRLPPEPPATEKNVTLKHLNFLFISFYYSAVSYVSDFQTVKWWFAGLKRRKSYLCFSFTWAVRVSKR